MKYSGTFWYDTYLDAGKVEDERVGGLNSDEQRQFPLARPFLAVRAAGKAQRVGVEGEEIPGGDVVPCF